LKILSLFSGPSLKPSWTFTPTDAIWRLVPARSGELVGEARNQETKRVSFFAIDGNTGVPLWQNLVLDEQWWIGIEDISDGVLLLHKFASPDMPQHRGIIAIDLRTGNQLWLNGELTFWFAYNNSVYAHKMLFEKRVASELDVHTGQTVREFGENLVPLLFEKREEAIRENQDGLQFPEIGEFDRIDPRIAGMMRKELPATEVRGPVEYAHMDKFLLMNYHILARGANEKRPLLDNQLKIIDAASGKVIYYDTIVHNSPAPVPDSFFVRNGTVHYIKDQKTLTAIHLAQ
jgi:hypothetical protein